MTALRLLLLVVLLNVARYLVAPLLEAPLVFGPLFAAMDRQPEIFHTEFGTFDWVTSYTYNFVMWLACAWLFHMARPGVRGSDLLASLKVLGVCWLFYASLAAIFMNHYEDQRDFYLWMIVDGAIAFAVVALANGVLYRRVMGRHAAARSG